MKKKRISLLIFFERVAYENFAFVVCLKFPLRMNASGPVHQWFPVPYALVYG